MSRNLIKGPVTMVFSAVCFAAMGFFAKLSSARISGSEVAFFRFFVGVGAVLFLAALGKVSLSTGRKKLLIMRGLFGGLCILFFFLALGHGALTNVTVLSNTYPIFATILAAFMLKEGLGWGAGISLTVSWIGVILLVHPDFHHLKLADIMALLSGFLGGFAIVVIRQLRQQNESAWNVFFYLSIFGLAISFLFALPVWVWPVGKEWIWLALTSLFGLIGQIAATTAYKYCSTALGGILAMTAMVFTALLGFFVLGERLTAWETAGVFLIALGSIFVILMSERSSQIQLIGEAGEKDAGCSC